MFAVLLNLPMRLEAQFLSAINFCGDSRIHQTGRENEV